MKRLILISLLTFMMLIGIFPQSGEAVLTYFNALESKLKQGPLPVEGSRGVVSTAEPHATLAGLAVLKAGGNAVDATVASAFALAVTYPQAGNIGGGGFLVMLPTGGGKAEALDFRECAPAAASRDMYLDSKGDYIPNSSLQGFKAAGVPGTVRGLYQAWKKHGSLPWATLLAPAVQLAEQGFAVSPALAKSLQHDQKPLGAFPATAKVFFKGDQPLPAGEILRQPDLAEVLKRIADSGDTEFYEGRTAAVLADRMAKNGGLITTDDLKKYQAVEREPVKFSYRGYELITMPPPSSGGLVLAEIFHVLEAFPLARLPMATRLNLTVEAMRLGFVDRAREMGDPDFVRVPAEKFLSADHADALRQLIKPGLSLDSRYFTLQPTSGTDSYDTTHLSVVDGRGGCVSLTYTLNGSYGCGAVAEGLGFLLNNEMDDFAAKPGVPNLYGLIQGEANAIQPGKRPLSSMTPAIVCKDGKPVLVVGSPGGPTIITTVGQVLLNVLEYGLDVDGAVQAPRVHHQWLPDVLYYEKDGLSPDVLDQLKAMGYVIKQYGPQGHIGLVECIGITWKEDGKVVVRGVTDPRGDGLAAGD